LGFVFWNVSILTGVKNAEQGCCNERSGLVRLKPMDPAFPKNLRA
jgi:hypothetical protein